MYNLTSTDNGNCRVYYRKKENGALFCFQEDRPNQFTFYLCSRDGEPECEATPKGPINTLPQGDETTARNFRTWFNANRVSRTSLSR